MVELCAEARNNQSRAALLGVRTVNIKWDADILAALALLFAGVVGLARVLNEKAGR